MEKIKSKIAMFLIGIAFRIMPNDELEDVHATLIHWNRQRDEWKK